MTTEPDPRATTVLIAEDDRAIRFSPRLFLKAEGYGVIEVGDGDEALSRIECDRPDAVLFDLKMPGRDGLVVLAALGPALADLPVIVITAYGGSAAAIEAMRRGAYDYLTKPFDLDEVHLTLKRALRQRALAFEVKGLCAGRAKRRTRPPTKRRTPNRGSSARAPRCVRSSSRSASLPRPMPRS